MADRIWWQQAAVLYLPTGWRSVWYRNCKTQSDQWQNQFWHCGRFEFWQERYDTIAIAIKLLFWLNVLIRKSVTYARTSCALCVFRKKTAYDRWYIWCVATQGIYIFSNFLVCSDVIIIADLKSCFIVKQQGAECPLYSYSIITVDAHKDLSSIHNRMPVRNILVRHSLT